MTPIGFPAKLEIVPLSFTLGFSPVMSGTKTCVNRFNGLPLDRLLSGRARRGYVTSQRINR